jgi:hypothetical protein
MERERIIDKLRKLNALKQSDNLGEAEAAAATAQRLIEQYRIETVELQVDLPPDEPIETQVLSDEGRNIAQWRAYLAGSVARANNCEILFRHSLTTRIMVVGVPEDIAIVTEMFGHLEAEVDRLALKFLKVNGGGKRAGNSFRYGAIVGIDGRLLRAKREAREGVASTALVRVDHDGERVREHVAAMKLKPRKYSNASIDPDAYHAGQRAGAEVRLKPDKAVGSGNRAALIGGF